MKTVARIAIIGFALLLLAACAALQGAPSGSTLAGEYTGTFEGKVVNGKITFKAYEASGEAKPLLGFVELGEDQLFFHGVIKNSQLDAQFTKATGTLKGRISADGSTISGTFTVESSSHPMIPPTQGTWKSSKSY
jgi:hypothetical protein